MREYIIRALRKHWSSTAYRQQILEDARKHAKQHPGVLVIIQLDKPKERMGTVQSLSGKGSHAKLVGRYYI